MISNKSITKKTVLYSIFLVISLSLIFSACNVGEVGIFYSVEKLESTKKENRCLEPTAPIHSFAELDGNYYITTPALRMREASATTAGSSGYNWKLVSTPSGYSIAGKVASNVTTLYVNFIKDSKKSGMENRLFSVPATSISYSGAGSVSWSEITVSGDVETFFIAEDNHVFAIIRQSDTYSIYDVTGSQKINDGSNIKSQMKFQPITDIAHISGTRYMALSIDMVYVIDTASSDIDSYDEVSKENSPFDSKKDKNTKKYGFSGLIQIASDNLYITTKSGYIFEYNGGTWSQYGKKRFSRKVANKVEYTAFLDMHDATGFTAPFDKIYAGSENHGYVIIDPSGSVEYVTISTTNTNFYSSKNSFVSNMYYDDKSTTLFALTPNNSLWRGEMKGSDLKWTKE